MLQTGGWACNPGISPHQLSTTEPPWLGHNIFTLALLTGRPYKRVLWDAWKLMSHFIKQTREIIVPSLGVLEVSAPRFWLSKLINLSLGFTSSPGIIEQIPHHVWSYKSNNIRSLLHKGDNCITQWFESIQTQLARWGVLGSQPVATCLWVDRVQMPHPYATLLSQLRGKGLPWRTWWMSSFLFFQVWRVESIIIFSSLHAIVIISTQLIIGWAVVFALSPHSPPLFLFLQGYITNCVLFDLHVFFNLFITTIFKLMEKWMNSTVYTPIPTT